MPLPRSRGLRYGRWCLLAALSATAQAQPLTADEAVRMALQRNPTLQAERQRIAEADAEIAGARLRTPFNPVAEAELGLRDGPDGTGADVVLGARQEIEIGGQRGRRIALASARHGQTLAEIEAGALALATEVRRAFAAALVARESLEYARQLSVLSKTLLDSAQLRFDEGASTKLELNLAKTELGKVRRDRLLAERAAKVSLLELRALLGMKTDEPLGLSVKPELPDGLPLPSEVLPRSLELRPELLALRQEARAAEAEGALARSLRTPNLELGARAGREGEETLAGLSLGVVLPLFNRQQAEVQGAEARRRRAELAEQALALNVEKDLLLAAERYGAAREALEIYQEEVLPLFEENLELLNEAFRTGKVNFLQVLSVQKEFVEQRQLYLESLTLAQEAWIDWQLAAGQILPEEN